MLETISENGIDEILLNFEDISLGRMNDVNFMNRFDKKYCLPTNQLQNILEEIGNAYFVLEIDGTRLQTYKSVYFDTPGNLFYLSHHNGIGSRIKIRKRQYVNSGICFFEIKCKSNKGKTSKKRIQILSDSTEISPAENHFLTCTVNYKFNELEVKSTNTFNRITLVSKNFDERCTIDLNIAFENDRNNLLLGNLAVIELKQGAMNMKSKLADSLKKNRIYPQGFSKYCMGRVLTEENLKKNRFKAKILKIRKQYNVVVTQNVLSHEYEFSY